jgi:hypothetical protein
MVLELVAARSRRSRSGAPRAAASVLPLVLFLAALVRTDVPHVVPSKLASFLALAVLLRPTAPGTALLSRWRAAALVVGLALVLPAAVRETLVSLDFLRAVLSPRTRFLDRAPVRGLIETPGDADRGRALELVAATRRPDFTGPLRSPSARYGHSRIWVGLTRHDRIWMSDVAFYFEAAALPASRYHVLVPWATRPEIQEQIVAELERAEPEVVVLVSIVAPDEPNLSAVTTQVRILDGYLAARYRLVAIHGPYVVLHRT